MVGVVVVVVLVVLGVAPVEMPGLLSRGIAPVLQLMGNAGGGDVVSLLASIRDVSSTTSRESLTVDEEDKDCDLGTVGCSCCSCCCLRCCCRATR